MCILHLCNTNFEWELTQAKELSLPEMMQRFPGLQLQFLPLLYAKAEEKVLVTKKESPLLQISLPNPPKMHLIDDTLDCTHVESWGASKNIAVWAKKKGLVYDIPAWDVIQTVNSKAFSFVNSPPLEGAKLLENENDAILWFANQKGPIVLKTCFGVAGGGHFIQETPTLTSSFSFLSKEWEKGLPMIAEPWVDRLLDFSTQWIIQKDKTIDYIGAALIENNLKGRYRQTQAGDPQRLFGQYFSYLEKHREIAMTLLQKMAKMGFFGNVGIDSMIYSKENETLLQPIVEINARKTMGWVGITLQKQHFPNQMIAFGFSPKTGFTINIVHAKTS